MPGTGNALVVRVRPASPADAAALARLQIASWREAYAGLLPDRVLASLSESEHLRGWDRVLARTPSGALVATHGEQLLGFALTGPSRDDDAVDGRTAELYSLYVSPDHWGRGVGGRLWSAARLELGTAGYAEATLWVLEDNRRARGFYQRVGFVLDPAARRVVDVQGAPMRKVRYRCALP